MSGVVTIVQARTGSTRLPGKVLLPLGDATVLDVMLGRVKSARLAGRIVVATTREPADDAITDIATRNGVAWYRGHTADLLDRHYQAALAHEADHVVKIPSDCPLIDPRVIDDVVGAYLARSDADYVSNLHPPTHVDGNDVEILRMDALAAAWRESSRPYEREHTTPFVWSRALRFRVANVAAAGPNRAETHRAVLDYPEDYEVIRRVYDALSTGAAPFTVDDVTQYLDDHPAIAALNERHRGDHWYLRYRDELAHADGTAARELHALVA